MSSPARKNGIMIAKTIQYASAVFSNHTEYSEKSISTPPLSAEKAFPAYFLLIILPAYFHVKSKGGKNARSYRTGI